MLTSCGPVGGCRGSQKSPLPPLSKLILVISSPFQTPWLWFDLPTQPLVGKGRRLPQRAAPPRGKDLHILLVFFLWATQWMATGTSGRAGALAQPPAPTGPSRGHGSATGPPTVEPSARDTGWRPGTASFASAQVGDQRLLLYLGPPASAIPLKWVFRGHSGLFQCRNEGVWIVPAGRASQNPPLANLSGEPREVSGCPQEMCLSNLRHQFFSMSLIKAQENSNETLPLPPQGFSFLLFFCLVPLLPPFNVPSYI